MDRKEYMKQYRLLNKAKTQEYNKTYFQENKQEIQQKRCKNIKHKDYQLEYQNTRLMCICGKELLRSSLYSHRKTCVVFLNSIQL